jgi:two-component system chemotaxis response regulator CheB
MAKKILVVDDSPTVRRELGNLFNSAGYDVALAKNGKEALEWLEEMDFDLVTLDINMPVMDGLTTLKEIMKRKAVPVLMISSLTTEDAEITFECLENGAVDFVPKPGTFTVDLKRNKEEILQKVKEALRIPKNRLLIRKRAIRRKIDLEKKKTIKRQTQWDRIVLIGASTGGPGKIEEIASSLPADYPYPICVVQHMPENFTGKFAERLNGLSEILVVEAKGGEKLESGKMIIAKGGYHLHFSRRASGIYSVKLVPNTMNHFFVPSVDEMFFSAEKVITDKNIMAIELTGIGDDGARGLLALRKKGAYTIAESEETAVVYGMPKVAWEIGGAMKKLRFEEIVEEILKFPKLDFEKLVGGKKHGVQKEQ